MDNILTFIVAVVLGLLYITSFTIIFIAILGINIKFGYNRFVKFK